MALEWESVPSPIALASSMFIIVTILSRIIMSLSQYPRKWTISSACRPLVSFLYPLPRIVIYINTGQAHACPQYSHFVIAGP